MIEHLIDISLILKIISVSASGALAPGPMTASSVAMGAKNGWKAGLGIAFGHTLVEFPFVLIIAYGLGAFFQIFWVRTLLGLAGGLFLLFFGYLAVRDLISMKGFTSSNTKPKYNSAVTLGIILTLFNPYFLAWWIGVGTPLLMEVLSTISLVSLVLFYLAHVWLDYSFLMVISAIGSVSKVNLRIYKIILASLAILILYFGVEMIINTLRIIL